MISVEHVSKQFNGKLSVDEISFQANEKEILVLLGTSGCGKTTTLKMINRLIEPDSGEVLIDGKNILLQKPEQLRRTIGFVMQHGGLFPHYTVAQNIAVVPDLQKSEKAITRQRTEELIHKLHLPEDILNRFPHQLSGGQQQRVGIARALIANPPILLMDEPFGALDNITKTDIHSEFKSLDELKNKTTILVTHDVQEAFELGHRVCLMDKGRIVQIGTPQEIIYHPKNDFVKGFFAQNRLLLEYKITNLKDLEQFTDVPALPGSDIHITADSSVWTALQHYSSEAKYAESYERLMQAFTTYRKQIS
ncbi:MAG: ABC transporter ATP-binding protein [Daejeonella sp.]|uniref:ABC transporter ATP-binding protein n=1 Tax=Daejeonella sp. TaxID=2805397 RepID=UPI003C78403C